MPDLSELRRFGALESLKACIKTLEDQNTLAALGRSLVTLDVSSYKTQCALHGLEGLRSLQLGYCETQVGERIVTFACPSLRGLTSLRVDCCVDDASVACIGGMTALQDLRGLIVDEVTDYSPLTALVALRTLCVNLKAWTATPLVDMSAIAKLTGLRAFEIHGCNRVRNLVPLASLAAFTTLYVSSFCDADLGPITALTGLRVLALQNHNRGALAEAEVEDLSPLTALSALTSLSIDSFPGVAALPWGLPCGLRHLKIRGCPKVVDLWPLQTLKAVSRMYIGRCPVLDLTPLGALTSLTDLDVKNIPAEDLTPLSALVGLQHLRIRLLEPRDMSLLLAACTALRNGVCGDACTC